MTSIAEHAMGGMRRTLPAALDREVLRRSYPLRYLRLMAVCFVLMRPIMVGQTESLAPIMKVLTAAIFAWLVNLYFLRRVTLSATVILFVLYRVSSLLPTVYRDGDLLNWGYVTLSLLSVLMLIELHATAGQEERRRLLRVMTDLLLIYLLINYVMILMDWGRVAAWGDGAFAQPSYLLGIRTRVTDCIFPAILLALLYDSGSHRRWGWRTVVAVASGIVQIATLQVATAWVGLAVTAAFYLAVTLRPHRGGLFSMRGATVMGAAATLLVVFARVQVFFAEQIEELLGKSVSLTGRTDLWDAAFPILADSPLFGYGINSDFGNFIPGPEGLLWQAHNQYLQIAYDGGLAAVGLFIALLWTASTRADASRCNPRARAAFVSVYAAMSVMAISEIYVYNMALFYLIPFLASRADELVGDDERRKSEEQ
ncbi:O-antigen ligase family protein [Actinomyces israelii]|uniref:O-antigen ligase family protein n=1 Tax=Actinomyces israelii TaxID=1659 RepID=UPI0025536B82|nr:O-antigen ligase family protein [Actinomyces israelii]WKR22235.1 hypothetical protein AIF0345_2177 [Actinomyces israelii]